MTAPLRVGTRRSELATSQARLVADALHARTGRDVELVGIVTEGDTAPGRIADLGGTGVFVSALRDALLDGRVDLAVHSLKDIPTAPAEGLLLAAVPEREDPRDVLVARDGLGLTGLPSGARIGTGSPRRTAMLRGLGLGLEVVHVRGNVGTRLAYVTDGELDAVVLARAGLARIGRLDVVTEVLDPAQVLSAPGQGALAVECRDPATLTGSAAETAAELLDTLRLLDDPDTRAAVTAERTLLATLEAGCTAPVGAYAVVSEGDEGSELYLRAGVAAVDGSAQLRQSITGPVPDAEQIGRRLAEDLLAAGAAGLLGERVP